MNQPKVETVEKQIDFAARAGEVITGELGRDVEGQFINIADFQADVSREMYLRLRSARLREKQRQRILDTLGGGDSKEAAKAKREAKQAASRAETFGQLAERRGLDKGDLEALASFRAGEEIDSGAAGRLAAQGLVEFDDEGQARMTASGSGLIRAANRGDLRIALDRISQAKERVKKKRERAEKAKQKAAETEKENRKIEQEIKQLQRQEQTGDDRARRRVERLRRQQRRNQLRAQASNSLAEDLFQRLGEGIRKSYPLLEIAKQAPPGEIEGEITDYETELNKLIEAAHNGEISEGEFSRRVRDLAGVALLALFLRGGDITEVELTAEERDRLQQEIDLAASSSVGLAADVYAGKFQGEDANSVEARIGLWGAAAIGVYALGQIHRRDDPLLRWELGAAEHSPNCLELAGQTRRASEWLAAGLYPKSGLLDCSLGCQCSLVEM